jgi:DNA polymerase III delta prime subunit
MALSREERIYFLKEPRWIGYPRADSVIKILEDLKDWPKRPRMPNLLIVGDSNNGKTTLIRRFVKAANAEEVDADGDPVKPVVLAEGKGADEKGLYMAILEKLLTPYRASDPIPKLRYQVIHLLRACKTRMLMIDELHALLTGSAIRQRELMNAIKLLCNELMIPIVGVGTSDAVLVLHTDPQLASRFDVAKLTNWEDGNEFRLFLAKFESVLPLKSPSNLRAGKVAELLLAISAGNMGNLQRLLVECATVAIETGKERIDWEIVQAKSCLRPTHGIRELIL